MMCLFVQENQERLFKGVVQFNPNKLQKGGGSGLGLYSEYMFHQDTV